jgi:hypothetical protein
MSTEWAAAQWDNPDGVVEQPIAELAIEPVEMTVWREDARFVGAFIHGGSWEVGLRIARSVQPGVGDRSKPRGDNSPRTDRISLREFAREAHVDHKTIAAYLRAWERAADDGKVKHAATLNPNDQYIWDGRGLDEEDWKRYYHASKPKPKPKPKPAPEPEPVKPEPQVDNFVPDPERVESAPDPVPVPTYVEDEPSVESRFLSAMSWVTDASIKLKNSAALVLHIDLSDEQRQRYIERLARLKSQVDLLYASIDGMGFDAGIASILKEGN